MESLYVYYLEGDRDNALEVIQFLEKAAVPFEEVEVQPKTPLAQEVADYIDGIEQPFPLVRYGQKIRVNLFAPSTRFLQKLIPAGGEGVGFVPSPDTLVMFTTTWCPDCLRMERFLGTLNVPILKINADSQAGLLESITRWSGGRRTVPSFQWGQSARFFNPSPDLIGRFLR